MELFRGYVPTRNKQCLEKFKGVEKLKTRSEVQDLDEYAGILGEETILIDVDDAETSELLFRIVQDLELKCRVYATTRGKHFLFKNCGVKKSWTKCTLAVGITTDGKVGANNRIDLIVFNQTGGCGDCALCGGLVVVNDEIDLTAIDAALGVPLCGGKTRAVFNQFAFNCRSAGQRCPDADTNGICIRGGDGGITVI